MKKGQLVSSERAKPAKGQHKKPCADCPWTRESVPGWLGTMSAREWIAAAHGEATADCHTLIGPQCAGMAVYRANVCKVTRHDKAITLPADRKTVSASPQEFLDHHEESDS